MASRIDWDNLEALPRKWAPERYERTRLLFKAKRKHPKRHNENRERAFRDQKKARLAKIKQARQAREIRAYKAAVRAYWLGQREEHPSL